MLFQYSLLTNRERVTVAGFPCGCLALSVTMAINFLRKACSGVDRTNHSRPTHQTLAGILRSSPGTSKAATCLLLAISKAFFIHGSH